MSNLLTTLKQEIRRVARREIKENTGKTRRAVAQHRREIAQLKRLVQVQERRIASLASRQQAAVVEQPGSGDSIPDGSRFSSRSVRAQRNRLRFSAEEFGRLLGVSAQTVYNWEHDKVRPGRPQFAALVAVRGIGRREALKRLDEADA